MMKWLHVLVLKVLGWLHLIPVVDTQIKYDANSDDEALDNYWYMMYADPDKWQKLYGHDDDSLMPDGCHLYVRHLSHEESEEKSPRAYKARLDAQQQ